MARDFRIEAVIPLPDATFAQAKLIAGIEAVVEQLTAELVKLTGTGEIPRLYVDGVQIEIGPTVATAA